MLFDCSALREPHLNQHTQRTLSSAKPLLPAPPDWERGKKKNTGWFVQVINFIPEQLEDTSLNVLPREVSEWQRSEAGAGRAGWDDAPQLRAAHTNYTAFP